MNEEFREHFNDMRPAEIAVFMFTADGLGNHLGQVERPTIIPTKDAIIWALCIHEFVRTSGYATSADFESIAKLALNEKIESFIQSRDDFFDRYRRSLSPYPVPLSHFENLFGLRKGMISTAKLRAIQGHESTLEDRGLIVDPYGLELSAGAAIVLGMIPYSFSVRTKKGREFAIELNALLWDFELDKSKAGAQYKFKLNIIRTVRIFKELLVSTVEKLDSKKVQKDDD